MKNDVIRIIRNGLDVRIDALKAVRNAAQRPTRGWLRTVRSAIGLNQQDVARKLGIKRQSYAQLEKAEQNTSITLSSAQRAAEAMGCELIYFVIPRESVAKTFTELATRYDPDFKHLKATEHSMALEGQAVGDLPSDVNFLP
jgi:predicted DNA-binding mobile mystery protein A